MTPDNTPASVAVVQITQDDRERAADIAWLNGVKNKVVDRYRSGELDKTALVEGLAKHRLAFQQPGGEVRADDTVRDISGETVAGFRVAAYRETHPEHGSKYGHHYSEHWSTPNSRHPAVKVERLFTEDQLRQALSRTTPDAALREALAAALPGVWTSFLDAKPDDLTSPGDLPDHALMTGAQFEQWAMEALEAALAATPSQKQGEGL